MYEELFSLTEVAKKLGITRQRAFQLVKEGKIIPLKTGPNMTIFTRSEIERYISQHKDTRKTGYNINPRELELMDFVLEKGKVTANNVAVKFGITRSTANLWLKYLERKGLVTHIQHTFLLSRMAKDQLKRYQKEVRVPKGSRIQDLVRLGLAAYLFILLDRKWKQP